MSRAGLGMSLVQMASISVTLEKKNLVSECCGVHDELLFQGETVDSEHLSELTEEEYDVNFLKPQHKGFMKLDAKYLIPFFTRRFTQQVGQLLSVAYTAASNYNVFA